MRIDLSGSESRIFWFILRKTYGFGKKTDTIPLAQFEKALRLDRRNVHRSLKRLIGREMVSVSGGTKKALRYGIQKDYERWKNLSSKMTTLYHRK